MSAQEARASCVKYAAGATPARLPPHPPTAYMSEKKLRMQAEVRVEDLSRSVDGRARPAVVLTSSQGSGSFARGWPGWSKRTSSKHSTSRRCKVGSRLRCHGTFRLIRPVEGVRGRPGQRRRAAEEAGRPAEGSQQYRAPLTPNAAPILRQTPGEAEKIPRCGMLLLSCTSRRVSR
jgi:hypothetical protein